VNKIAQIQKDVQEYYGQVIQKTDDLKAKVCCPVDSLPDELKPFLKNIHNEVQERFYGCASSIPPLLEGLTILDLGSGTGRDCYLFSQLVGPEGNVIGVDMTDEQLAVANKYIPYHMERFGYSKPNVDFRKSCIEDLKSVGIEDNSVDLIFSNCVLNLSPDKEKVFSEIFRVLKPGGELYFSDVYAGRRVPKHLQTDPVLVGECLGGALYLEDFRRIMQKVGFLDFRTVSQTRLDVGNPEIEKKAGMIDFYSTVFRSFKCNLEDICENFGHVAYYNGTIPGHLHEFELDDHHLFRTGMPVPICGNTTNMLSETRYKEHFKIVGDFSTHYGPFDCTPDPIKKDYDNSGACC